ncbi:hypothetical protein ACFL2U_03030 [Patescibacteria group bacterium]
MGKDSLAAKAIFPHQSIVPGQEVKLNKEGEQITCKVTSVCPMEGNKFVVWLLTAAGNIRVFWLQGKFHFNMPDGPEVTIL